MNSSLRRWFYLGLLSLIWGSSFILIKKGLTGFSPIQLGSLRIVFAAIFLLFIASKSLWSIPKKLWPWVVLSGLCGSFFPSFLFAFAETKIDSATASILNATTPLFALLLGLFLFKIRSTWMQFLGVLIGLVGTIGLIYASSSDKANNDYAYALLVLIATFCYATNVNLIKSKLHSIPATSLATANFAVLLIPAAIIFTTESIRMPEAFAQFTTEVLLYVLILGTLCTGLALIWFNRLIQMTTPVFASSVTYTIPIVALVWGVLDGESIGWLQILSMFIVFLGVFVVQYGERSLLKLKFLVKPAKKVG
ncbi:MAG: DMT family transporter [Flavobacteriaceae bacterium]|nr:DMT family transporter [Flavobacteriaceae bacterium]